MRSEIDEEYYCRIVVLKVMLIYLSKINNREPGMSAQESFKKESYCAKGHIYQYIIDFRRYYDYYDRRRFLRNCLCIIKEFKNSALSETINDDSMFLHMLISYTVDIKKEILDGAAGNQRNK